VKQHPSQWHQIRSLYRGTRSSHSLENPNQPKTSKRFNIQWSRMGLSTHSSSKSVSATSRSCRCTWCVPTFWTSSPRATGLRVRRAVCCSRFKKGFWGVAGRLSYSKKCSLSWSLVAKQTSGSGISGCGASFLCLSANPSSKTCCFVSWAI